MLSSQKLIFRPSDTEFVNSLSSTSAGAKIRKHLFSLQHILLSPHEAESSIQQCIDMIRCFFFCIARSIPQKKTPFGLPSPLPKFILISNFSGERSIVYSSNPALLRVGAQCASNGALSEKRMLMLSQLSSWASTRTNGHVVIVASMPWQSGPASGTWEARTFLLSATPPSLVDGQLTLTSIFDAPKTTPSTLQGDTFNSYSNGIARMSSSEEGGKSTTFVPFCSSFHASAMLNALAATDLDTESDKTGESTADTESDSKLSAMDEKLAKLNQLCATLQKQRAEMQTEIQDLTKAKDDMEEKLKEERLSVEEQKTAMFEEAVARASTVMEIDLLKIQEIKEDASRARSEALFAAEEAEKKVIECKRISEAHEKTKRALSVQSNAQNAIVIKLKAELEAKTEALEDASKEKLKTQSLLQTAKASLSDRETVVAALAHSDAALRSELEDVKKKLKEEQREVEELQGRLKIVNVQVELETARAKAEAQKADEARKKAEEKMKKAKAEADAAKAEADAAKAEADAAKAEAEASKARVVETRDAACGRDAGEESAEKVVNPYQEIQRLRDRIAELENKEKEEEVLSQGSAGSTGGTTAPPASAIQSVPSQGGHEFISADTNIHDAASRVKHAMAAYQEWVDYMASHPPIHAQQIQHVHHMHSHGNPNNYAYSQPPPHAHQMMHVPAMMHAPRHGIRPL